MKKEQFFLVKRCQKIASRHLCNIKVVAPPGFEPESKV